MADRVPITYTFGNHMHWVDMQWLWGYHVLPGSVRDMLHFCHETGAKGNVNFDGIGYEKLACEDPEAFAQLRAAVQSGMIEVVGASYGQPYGLFHGGESNVRQRVYGARTVRRLFGKWPKTFWEEEFDFFPQLPQILRGCGFQNASLYFQWTWHTPEVPREDVPVVWWEGCDGSRLKTATRNRLNLHQWPEDVQILMDELAETGGEADSLILQWLELMPSPDWMCRSEVLLPKTKELLGDERFQVSFATLGEYLDTYKPDPPTRRYTMDDVWHGMSLGKNNDDHPRRSAEIEATIMASEAAHSIAGRFGRPYAQWDVYPTWENEEAWRNLLAAQHHDNHECEELCGRVGYVQMSAAEGLADAHRAFKCIASRVWSEVPAKLVLNTSGWDMQVGKQTVPAWGYQMVGEDPAAKQPAWYQTDLGLTYESENISVVIDFEQWSAEITRHGTKALIKLPTVEFERGGVPVEFGKPTSLSMGERPFVVIQPTGDVGVEFHINTDLDALGIDISFDPDEPYQDPGFKGSAKTVWPTSSDHIRVVQPYEVTRVRPNGTWPRKYPTGDWMTSPQWFESVQNPFVSHQLVDLVNDDGTGLTILHDHQQWFKTDDSIKNVFAFNDPWDEMLCEPRVWACYLVLPHRGMTDADRYKLSKQGAWMTRGEVAANANGDLPTSFSFASNTPDNVVMTALYRETRDRGYGTDSYAANDFEADYPYIIRLVEFDGIESQVELKISGTVAAAAKTNLLGQHELTLTPELGSGEYGPQSTLRFSMRPKEIATVYFDLVEGRKQTRDLDAKREIWATVHRTETTT